MATTLAAATIEPENKVTFESSGELGWGVPPGQPRYVVPTMAPTSAPTSAPTPAVPHPSSSSVHGAGDDTIQLWSQPLPSSQTGLSQEVRTLSLAAVLPSSSGGDVEMHGGPGQVDAAAAPEQAQAA